MKTPLRHRRFLLNCLTRKDEDTFGEPAEVTCPECKERILGAALEVMTAAQKNRDQQEQAKTKGARA